MKAILLTLIVLIAALFWWFGGTEKSVSGWVENCKTGQRVENVKVSVRQTGPGITSKGEFVWDMPVINDDVTDEKGTFLISYEIGSSAHIIAEKAGYLTSDSWHMPGANIKIGLLERKKEHGVLETTTNCKLLSECLHKEVQENGTVSIWNVCESRSNL